MAARINIPLLGVGTWQLREPQLTPALRAALEAGCRHIDCAAVYENEAEVGAALAQLLPALGIARSEIFVTSKLWCTMYRPEDVPRGLKQTLENLCMDYVDLYLMHWPLAFVRDTKAPLASCTPARDAAGAPLREETPLSVTWAAMEALLDAPGRPVRAIGVSNFDVPHLKALLATARVTPAANQIEMHPYLPQDRTRSFCTEHGIVPVAYSPLGSRGVLGGKHSVLIEDPAVCEIAERRGITHAQVLLGWAMARGTPAIPKTSNPERMRENLKSKPLSAEDVEHISKSITTRVRFCDPIDFWGLECFEPDS